MAVLRTKRWQQKSVSIFPQLGVLELEFKIAPIFLHFYDFREEIAKTVMKTFRTACDPWGITVERVEVWNFSQIVNYLIIQYPA